MSIHSFRIRCQAYTRERDEVHSQFPEVAAISSYQELYKRKRREKLTHLIVQGIADLC